MSEVEDFFRGQTQQAQAGIVGSLDDDPEQVARSLELEKASGTPAGAIVGDVEGFERSLMATLGSAIIQGNAHIADYLNSHPLAPRLSHDDLGQLDTASQSISRIPEKSSLQRLHDALKLGSTETDTRIFRSFREGFGEASSKAFLSDPFIKNQEGIDYAISHPLYSSITMGTGGLIAAPLTLAGKTFGGVAAVVNEFFGREAAGMFEYGLMRGDIRSAGTGSHADFAQLGQSLKAASPWLRAGKTPPAGIDPLIDKSKIEQAKADSDALSDALKESLKSTTRERNADFYTTFARTHVGDKEIGISADAVRELYGDKAPKLDDNLLGWVPDIETKLQNAEATGGDIRIPLADWLAKVEPETAKLLEDHIRARPDGITVEEGKNLKPLETAKPEALVEGEPPPRIEGSVIHEPHTLVRGGAALEPMFSIGDRKVKLERMKQATGTMFGEAQGFHDFDIVDENSAKVGSINLSKQGSTVYIEMINAGKNKEMYDPNFLGPALMRDLLRQIKAEFPDAETITGHRVSGAREKAGTYDQPHAMMKLPTIRLEALDDPLKWKGLHEGWQEIQRGVQGKPIKMTPEKQKVVDAVNTVLDRIVPKGVGVEGFEKIRTDAGDAASGVYTRYEDTLPWISWSLESGDPTATARHEAIHHLKRSGFFNAGEWDTLSRAARDGDWVKRYNIDTRFDAEKLTNTDKLEESIADAYKNWARQPEAETPLGKIFSRIKEILDSIRASLKETFGKDLSWEEIFQKVEKGEIGERDSTNPMGSALKFETGDILDIGGKEAERLRERIQALSSELSVAKSQGFDIKSPDFEARATELSEAQAKLRSITSGTFGMSVPQYQRYMNLIKKRNAEDLAAASDRALAQQRKTQTKEWKAQRTEMRDEVREEIEADPSIALDQMFAAEKLKFHPDSLSPEQRAMLPKDYLQKKNGVDPNDAAGFFGFNSGDALVTRLASVTAERKAAGMTAREWANHLIDTETDRRMEERHGNLDQKILEEAKDQAISETQLDLLHEEVLHLGLKANSEFPISKAQLRQWNKEIFDKTPIDSISTDDYLRAAGKAGKAAEMSLLKEDFADAFRKKQRQNNAMIMASYAKAYERARTSFDRTAKTFQKREVPSVPAEWTNWIHDLLQRTGNRVNRSVQDLTENISRQAETDLTSFIEAKEAETFGLRETPVADFLLDPNFRTEMGKLTAEQFFGLKQSIDTLVKQGRDEKKIYAAGEAADRDVVLREMREKLGTFPVKALPDEAPLATAMLKLPRMFMAGMTNIETLLNRWDRADPRGIFNRYVAQPLAKAANHKSSLEREYARAYGELGAIKDGDKFVDAPFPDPLTRSETDPEGRPWPGFTRKHVLAMLQNAGNKGNWRVLSKGFGAEPEALMEWLHSNTTKADWDRAQKMGDSIFHSLIGKADVVYENMTGAMIEKIPLEPIQTPYGEYKGWYHPLIADPIRKEVWVKAEYGTWQRNATGKRGSVYEDGDYFHASTANGYTKRRTGAVYPLDLNFDVVPSRIKQMIHDIAFRQTIVETEKVFGNKSFQAEVTKHYGSIYTDLLMPYLRNMAGAESITSKAGAEASRISEYLRQNAISTYIGFNPFTALKHGPTAWVMSMREVGGTNFLSAVKGLYGVSSELGLSNSEFAMKHSEELQRRERHWQDTIAGEHKEIEGASTLREKVIEKGSWLVAQSDMLSAKPTWVAAYNKYIGDGLSHGESVDLADRAVRRAHGSTAQTNQPALVRGGGPLHGWLTSVYGFFGTAMQRRIEIAHTLNDTYKLGKEGEIKAAAANIPKLTTDIMTYVIWPTIVEEWVTGLNTEDKRGWGAHLISGASMGLASSVLYLRDLVHAFSTGHDPGVGLLSSPLHDLANVVRDVRRGKEAFNRQHAGKTVGDVLTIFGEGTGLAPKTIGNATRFGIDLVNKQQHPKTIPEWTRGFLRGTAKKREEK